MRVILSKYQTISRLELSELLVIMTKYDLDVNFHACDLCDRIFMECCVCGPRTHHHMAFC